MNEFFTISCVSLKMDGALNRQDQGWLLPEYRLGTHAGMRLKLTQRDGL